MTNEKKVFLNLIKDYISGDLSVFDCSVDGNEVYEYVRRASAVSSITYPFDERKLWGKAK